MMRRKDREITDPEEIDRVIRDAYCCRLGFQDGDGVYIVPLSFGFEHREGVRRFFFHGAAEGRKIELLRRGGPVGFELDTGYELIRGERACNHSARYKSVIGTGHAAILEDPQEKTNALNAIMLQTAGKDGWSIPEEALRKVCVFSLTVEEISCKERQ